MERMEQMGNVVNFNIRTYNEWGGVNKSVGTGPLSLSKRLGAPSGAAAGAPWHTIPSGTGR